MDEFGFQDRWALIATGGSGGNAIGIAPDRPRDLGRGTDLLLNVSGILTDPNHRATVQRPQFKQAARFIDDNTDRTDVVLDVNPVGVGGTNGEALLPPALTLDINFDEPHDTID